VPGLFAAGDVRHDSVKRVASAVGEGAMASPLCSVISRPVDHGTATRVLANLPQSAAEKRACRRSSRAATKDDTRRVRPSSRDGRLLPAGHGRAAGDARQELVDCCC